jgi:hypothetical protein
MGDQGDSDPAAGARAATARGARGVQPQGGHHQRVHRAPRVRPRHAAVEPHESSRQKRPSRPLYGRPAQASPCRAARRRQAEGNAPLGTSSRSATRLDGVNALHRHDVGGREVAKRTPSLSQCTNRSSAGADRKVPVFDYTGIIAGGSRPKREPRNLSQPHAASSELPR